ncbi:LytTR family DNA-binding domain-containing protein [uncultured Aquimarina sp.]|uniref:LytR/AlgR family response regulator transcription factor n=1 Tax=uncultured Aquimarina sp. TaxID=575652 RepID=UPI00261DCB93|nr:LytTR family DNA-binding domain-containing protein [uncultured Aquimarina sp.]
MDILILEDEQRAGEKLIDTIKSVTSPATITWKRSIVEAIDFLKTTPSLDIIFSDIELLDGNVFMVYDAIQPDCPIIFCTAYNTFYVNAFNTNGIAYLLKPYTIESFNAAWNKFLLLCKTKKEAISTNVFDQLKYLLELEKKQYKSTFSIKKRDGVFLLKVAEIMYFQAQGDFVLAIDKNDNKHIINNSLKHIENEIDKNTFFKINRSEIINRNNIIKYNQHIKNRLKITLNNTETTLYTSNSKASEFKNWLHQ